MSDRAALSVDNNKQEQPVAGPDLFALINHLNLPALKSDAPAISQANAEMQRMKGQLPVFQPSDWDLPASSGLQWQKQVLQNVQKESEAAPPSHANDAAARDYTLGLLKPDARLNLDLLRLELSLSSGKQEIAQKQAEISKFLSGKLGRQVPEAGLQTILAPPATAELMTEISKARPQEAAALLKSARTQMLDKAQHSITDGARLTEFENELKAFEKRSDERGISQEEQLTFYLQLARILDPATVLAHGHKSLLARSLMANAADPTSIDQGAHNTCNVTTLECRMFTQQPGTAAKVVADTACTGQFVTADGTVVHPPNLDPDREGRLDPTPDGLRNYASQIWQLTAINSYWSRKDTLPGGKYAGKGNIQYGEGPEGEFLMDNSTNPPQKAHFNTIDSDNPWLDIYDVSQINEQLTGHPSRNFGIVRWFYPSDTQGVSKVVTYGGFVDKLSELKHENAFPVIISVDASKAPFGNGKGYGPHVVTITDFDPASGLVSVDNQWGKRNDFTGLPGEKPKPTAEVVWSAMNQVPAFNFFWGKIKDGLKDVQIKDSIGPTETALTGKGLRWGISAAAPVALRGGLGYLSDLGVPGAADLLSASETRLGSMALRTGSSLAALGAFAYMNDLPGAFRQGASHGTGKLLRISGDWASFEVGAQTSNKILAAAGLWAPVRIPVSLAAGMAGATVFDRLLGESSEIGGSQLYDQIHDYLRPQNPFARIDKPIKTAPVKAGSPLQINELPQTNSMTSQFLQQYKSYDQLFSKTP